MTRQVVYTYMTHHRAAVISISSFYSQGLYSNGLYHFTSMLTLSCSRGYQQLITHIDISDEQVSG